MDFGHEILETLFSQLTSYVYLLDTNLRVTYVNTPLLKVLNKDLTEILGRTVLEIGYDAKTSEKLHSLFAQVLKGQTLSGEDLFIDIRGNEKYFEYTFAPVKEKNGKIVAISVFCRDISDRKKMEFDLTQSVIELQKERELRESFITAMTHDLRTPLTAAKLSAQIIQKHPSDRVAISKFSARIIENVERTDAMIRDLLDSLRLKAGEGITLNIELGVMNFLIDSLIEELKIVHGNRFQIEMNEMIKGYWDSLGIRRVLDNLLTNAIKYGAPDKTITIKLFKQSEYICISVHNFGETLNEDELKDLFLAFKRLKNARESGQKGWGIGLTLVNGIVEAHGGFVAVESTQSEGTTFTIKLPV